MKNIRDVKNKKEFSEFLGIPLKKLTYILYIKKVDNLYFTFSIPKKSGGTREIHSPHKELKDIQSTLADLLYNYREDFWKERKIRPNISHGFEKNKSIITNANIHKNKRFIYNLDLENFFDTFHFGRVKGFFEKNRDFKLPSEVATIIAQLTCYNGSLPQGSPCSPIITNLICTIFDNRIMKLAKKYRLIYTRYVDDLTFSTNDKKFLDKKESFLNELTHEIERAGFKLNNSKTNLQFKDSRQTVTGLVVNKKVNVDRRYYKDTRAMANCLYKTGSFKIDGQVATIKQLEGRLTFINQLQWENNKKDDAKHDFWKLSSKEKQYQIFLFYKYFFFNDKPIVITEGKTDIKYIQAALKKYYLEYPNLVVKNDEGKFEYKFMFLNRTKRLQHFFGLYNDGADAMKNIYNYFSNKKNNQSPNYIKYFKDLSDLNPNKPTIFVFDNELSNKDKPLKKFVTHASLSPTQQKELKDTNHTHVSSSLYLLVNPLVNGLTECEIEDLFSEDILSHMINGKTFSREKNSDPKLHYGKDSFSKYIIEEYKKIDFKNFKPILTNLNSIIINYKK